MKYIQSAAVICALVCSGSHAFKLDKDQNNLSQVRIEDLNDGEVTALVNKAVENAKNKKPKKEDAEKKAGEMATIEKALARRILKRLAGNYSNVPSLDDAVIKQIQAVKQYNDLLTAFALTNGLGGLGGLLGPSYADILKVIGILKTDKKKSDTKSTSLLQLEEQGVPVLVKPTLLENQTAKSDLAQRNYVIDGVNGFDFTQLSDDLEGLEDEVTLQVNGVPVIVNPVLMRSTGMEKARFGNKIRINLDEVTYLQTQNPVENPPFNNWSVNQPSPPHQHGMKGNEDLGQRDIIIDGVNYDFVQTNEKGVPVYVNPVLMRPTGMEKARFGNKIRINLDDVTYLGEKEEGVPVLVKPTLLENQTAKSDLAQRNYVIDGVDGFDFAQTEEEGVPVYVKPKLMKDEVANHDFKTTISVGGDKVSYADSKSKAMAQGVPVYVKPKLEKDHVADHQFNNTISVGGDKVTYADKKGASEDAITLQVNGVPVLVDPILMKDEMGHQNLQNKILLGPDDIKYTQWQM